MVSLNTLTAAGAMMTGLGLLGQFIPVNNIGVLFLRFLGCQTYRIRRDKDRVKGVTKILEKETISTAFVWEYGRVRPGGSFFGRDCFGYYTENDSDTEIYISTTPEKFKKLMDETVVESNTLSFDFIAPNKRPPINPKNVLIWSRAGSYTNIYYRSTQIDMSSIEPIGEQVHIIEDIVAKYKQRERLVAFVHGVTGAGKSTLGLFVAKQLNGLYCHTFNPSEPGDTFDNLVRETETMGEEDERKPIVVVIEEANEMIRTAHTKSATIHKNVTTQVKSKGTFNTFLDNLMFHKKVVLILTSNESKEDIDVLCPSYLRRGRINAYYSMMKPLEVMDDF
jgi:hypothetical protein